MTTIPMYQVDAFAERAFTGNPAAVCFPPRHVDDAWLQRVAAEMNLSETAFLFARDDGAWDLRWLTPATEVDLCGHATLASAHVLFETERGQGTLRFHTRSGVLTAVAHPDGVELDFPATPPTPAEAPPGLLAALGLERAEILSSRFDYLVVVDDEAIVRGLAPDLRALAAVEARGVIVTARVGTGGVDFVSRFFAPAVGVDEDPVTGSAHCALAPYWAGVLGHARLIGHQASARGGTIGVELVGDRVKLRGGAVTVLRGELVVDA